MPKPGKDLRLFLDANVIFSAAYSPEGRSAMVFLFGRRKRCRLVSSRFALEEARRNLEQQRTEALKVFSKNLPWIRVVPEADASAIETVASIGLDPGDVPILAAAIGQAAILVTGDRKHFGPWMGKTVYGLRILSLAAALDLIISGEESQ
jgi:predicted nucleic acid-binding protein